MKGSLPTGERILLVDDDADELAQCARAVESATAATIITETRSRRAAELLRSESFDLVVTDMRMPLIDGKDLLKIAHGEDPDLAVVILTGHPSVATAVEMLKLGAADYVLKPVNVDELTAVVQRLLMERRLRRENQLLQRQFDREYAFEEMVGASPAMQRVFDTVRKLAEADVDILIVGETGTGKELVARSIHKRSRDRAGRFVPVDCAALPDNLLESELFGHERGAFSGAHARSIGLMEFADRGTFFLDEVHALPLGLQAKLLRSLQERRIRRVGARQEIDVDLRVIAAANRDPAELVRTGEFREDLYFRLNVGRVELPPLRDRTGDVPLLATHFLQRNVRKTDGQPAELSDDAIEVLNAYHWPGNVRELENIIRRTLALTRAKVLTPDELPDEIVSQAGKPGVPGAGSFFGRRAECVREFEREYLTDLLRACAGDVPAAAKQAHLPCGTLYRLMKKHDMAAGDFRATSA